MPEGIHHEVQLDSERAKVFRALTDAVEFAEMTGAAATLTDKEGDAFSLFGGMITGRNIEVVANRRVVQAWRPAGWPEGLFSIVSFQLDDGRDEATTIIFDHTGFPEEQKEHLAAGWESNYWQPLRNHLA